MQLNILEDYAVVDKGDVQASVSAASSIVDAATLHPRWVAEPLPPAIALSPFMHVAGQATAPWPIRRPSVSFADDEAETAPPSTESVSILNPFSWFR
jgi:hypothetical protein